jgi:predicted phosphodiesterase
MFSRRNPSEDILISKPYIPSQSQKNIKLLEKLAKRVYKKRRCQQKISRSERISSPAISVVCISDTHNTNPLLPPGDILLHAGDLSQYGLFDEVQKQLDWLNGQLHQHKIVIAGNHDLILDQDFVNSHPDRELDRPGKTITDLKWGNIIYLQHQSVTVTVYNQQVKIFGSPWTPRCGNFAFQYKTTTDFWKNTLPDDLDILLVHGPLVLHLDGGGKGCPHLLTEIWEAQPKLVVYGHIHEGRGEELVAFDKLQLLFEQIQMGRHPWRGLLQLMVHNQNHLPKINSEHCNSSKTIHFVNSAVVSGPGHCNKWEPIVVMINSECE